MHSSRTGWIDASQSKPLQQLLSDFLACKGMSAETVGVFEDYHARRRGGTGADSKPEAGYGLESPGGFGFILQSIAWDFAARMGQLAESLKALTTEFDIPEGAFSSVEHPIAYDISSKEKHAVEVRTMLSDVFSEDVGMLREVAEGSEYSAIVWSAIERRLINFPKIIDKVKACYEEERRSVFEHEDFMEDVPWLQSVCKACDVSKLAYEEMVINPWRGQRTTRG